MNKIIPYIILSILLIPSIASAATFTEVEEIWLSVAGVSEVPGKEPTLVELGCGDAWEFSDNAEEDVSTDIKIPYNVNLSYNTTISIGWSSPAVDKTCNWNFTYSITKIDEDTSTTCEYYHDDLVNSSTTANGLSIYSFNITEITADDVCIHFELERDGNDPNDNLSDVAHLHGLCIRSYIDTQTENDQFPSVSYAWIAGIGVILMALVIGRKRRRY